MPPTFALLAALLMLSSAAFAQSRYEPTPVGPVRDMGYTRFRTVDSLGRDITFYLTDAPSRDTALPLVVYVHGSGHRSHFLRTPDGVTPSNGHATLADVIAGRARLVVVEKPGVSLFDHGDGPASADFREAHTLERWTEAVVAAMLAAGRVSGVDPRRMLVVGHSEGGLVAARVAARVSAVSHVALLAGGGPSQLLDLLLLARRGTFFRDIASDADAREAYVRAQWDSILAHPDAADRMFFGHAYRRWASFLRDAPMTQLRQSGAQIFLAQGAQDEAVSRESFDALAADLTGAGRRPVQWLVPHADHSFRIQQPERAPDDGWPLVLGRVVAWYLDSRPTR